MTELSQSRTQSLQAFWSAGQRREDSGDNEKIHFFDWLFRNGFHCFTTEILR